MLDLVRELSALDLRLVHETSELRWGPATAVFAVASAWWVKGPLLISLGGLDALRRRAMPLAMLAAAVAFAAASLLSGLLKDAFERPRPPAADPSIDQVGSLPASWSFPSGHAMTAFAAATAVAVLCPRMRVPALAIAALVAVSRPYLGVHFWFDAIAGAAFGAVIGAAVALAARTALAR